MDTSESFTCRFCAESKAPNKIINLQTNVPLCEKIYTKLTRVNAVVDYSASNLPNTVCVSCINDLECAYSFVMRIERAQVILNERHSVSTIKEEVPENYLAAYRMPNAKSVDCLEIKVELSEDDTYNNTFSISSERSNKIVSSKSLDKIPLAELQLTWRDFMWICAFCKMQFPTVDELKTHSISQHDCCNAYWCASCNIRKISLSKFLIHIRRHKSCLQLSCYKCFMRFKSAHEMRLHLKEHITSEFVCDGCNDNFTDSEELNQHKNEVYKDRRSRATQRSTKLKTKNVSCSLCQKSFQTKTGLKYHLLSHTDRKRDHICEICGKCFFSEHQVLNHKATHSGIKPYKCEICNTSFRIITQLRSHVRIHEAQKPFSCEQCGRNFRLQKQLKQHSIVHTDLLPYVCTCCNKRFRYRTKMLQHLIQHTGTKPYNCDICTRDFTNWSNYNKHMKRIHDKDMSKRKFFYTNSDKALTESRDLEEWKTKVMTPKRRKKKYTDENN